MSAIPRPNPERGGRPSARPPRRPSPRPVPPPARGAAPASPPPRPDGGFVERRRHKRGWFSRWIYSPMSLEAIESGAGRVSRRAWSWLRWVLPVLLLAAIAAGAWWWNWTRAPLLTPRDRAEALCFLLAEHPTYAPPMHVESGAATVRGRFSADTPPALAIRAAMRLGPEMVVTERQQRVGDYDVTILWLRLPTAGPGHHWLVFGWMEDTDLVMCSFRFAGDANELTPEQREWGRRLTDRVLQPEYFRAGVLPDVRWRMLGRDPLPSFGPRTPN